MTTPALPPGFVLDQQAPQAPLPSGFVLDNPAPTAAGGVMDSIKQGAAELGAGFVRGARDLGAGFVRGAGSIGATLMAPGDALQDLIDGRQQTVSRNDERRQKMTDALQTLGADTDSINFILGKLTGEVAGTAGAGGAVANVAERIPGAAAAAGPLIEAVRTSGMSAGGLSGAEAAAVRAVGGAVSGGVSAGMVDPSAAKEGAAIGAALPVAAQVAGRIGKSVGNVITGPAQTAEQAAAIKAARDAGYVLPPTQAKPTLGNRVIEGLAGKLTTAQNASARNQAVTNGLAARALGLPRQTQITPELLESIRDTAGRAYADLGATGVITPRKPYFDALDKIAKPFELTAAAFPQAKPSPVLALVDSLRSPAFASASAVEKIKQLRTAADDAFRGGNTDVGRAAKAAAKALEDAIEDHLHVIGEPQKLQAFRDARQLIAKTYSVEKALNPETGAINAKVLAGELKRGKPLSGELKQIAQFASRFEKAAQVPEKMGSLPGLSPLDFYAGGGLAGAGALLTGSPVSALALGLPVARMGARGVALSPLVQDRLIQGPGGALSRLPYQSLEQLGFQAAPVIGASGR